MSEQAKADWYPDPSGDPGRLRYWNGAAWTNDYTVVSVNQGSPATGGTAMLLVAFIFAIVTAATLGLVIIAVLAMLALIAFASPAASAWAMELTLMASLSFLLAIPFAWLIPMTVRIWKIYKGEVRITTGFAICTLLFVNMISGILLLVSNKE